MLRPSGVVGDALRVVASHGLRGAGSAPFGPLSTADWSRFLLHVRAERIAGLLDRTITDGALLATPHQVDEAEADASQGARGCVRLEHDLLTIANVLEGAGIEFRVMKGAAVAHLDEPDPVLRQYGDVDLLVHGRDLRATTDVLAPLGYARDLPERRSGFDERFGKEISLARPQGEVDVHRTLALGALGLAIDLDALWASSQGFVLGGRSLTALDVEGRFVQACFNAVLGDDQPRLVALRDVATMATRSPLRAETIWSIAPPGRGAAVVGVALQAVVATLGVDLGDVRHRLGVPPTSRWERLVLRAYRAQGGSNTLELLSGAASAPFAARGLYLRSVLFPDAGYQRARRDAGRPVEWQVGLRELVRSKARVR